MTDLRRLKNRIDRFCANSINSFSPTISPAPKSLQRNEIESIFEAILYFFNCGVAEIVVQRKYMGSYCDIYLQKNLDETYFVSRNGYLILQNELDEARQACFDLHNRFDWTTLQTVIVQSEIMPWSILGKTLIDNDFGAYLNVHQNHYRHLSNSQLYAKIDAVKLSQSYSKYMNYRNKLAEKKIREHFPEQTVCQYESLNSFKVLDIEEYKRNIDVYARQFEHFGQDGKMFFKPFNILKKIFINGSELIVNDNMSFSEVNDDDSLNLHITNEEELNRSIDMVYDWFAKLEEENEEGIVIKPRLAFISNVPPAFKVRNNQYLTMIYGIDFRKNYGLNLQKRKIDRKLECSINSWMLNRELLKIKYSDLSIENPYLKKLLFDCVVSESIASNLDPRL